MNVQELLTEDQIQTTIVDGLEALGCRVFITSRRVKKCQYCGEYPKRAKDGVTKGTPDLFFTKDRWPPNVMFCIEVKGPKTKLSPEQTELVLQKRTTIARSWDEALLIYRAACEAVARFEAA